MYNKAMKVGIIYKKGKLKDESVLSALIDGFQERGVETKILNGYDELVGLDFVVVLGGDGAILHSAVVAAKNNIKIVGINYGTLGFLTEYESRDTKQVISLICDGNYRVQKRSVLKVECKGNVAYCLNEVCIQRNALAPSAKQMIEFGAEMNGRHVDDFLSDGLIVCTPTGSTAYSLSAGGCIMTPEVKGFMLTPVCAFSLRSRPIIFPDDVKLSVVINREKDNALLFCDGKFLCEANHLDKISIMKADFTADFITGEDSSFFDKLNGKFGK